MNKAKLVRGLKGVVKALDAALDEQQRAANGQFGSGSGTSSSGTKPEHKGGGVGSFAPANSKTSYGSGKPTSAQINKAKIESSLKDIENGIVATGQNMGKKFSDLPKEKLKWMAENLGSRPEYRGDPVNVATAKAARKALGN